MKVDKKSLSPQRIRTHNLGIGGLALQSLWCNQPTTVINIRNVRSLIQKYISFRQTLCLAKDSCRKFWSTKFPKTEKPWNNDRLGTRTVSIFLCHVFLVPNNWYSTASLSQELLYPLKEVWLCFTIKGSRLFLYCVAIVASSHCC